MRFIGLVFLVSLAVSPALAAQAKKGPVMEIEPEDHDFGGVPQQRKLVHEFSIRNEGTEALEIRRIATSCGCAAAVPDDKVVPPGGSTRLVVTLETRKYKGFIEKSVSVASNNGIRTIRVRAFVEVAE